MHSPRRNAGHQSRRQRVPRVYEAGPLQSTILQALSLGLVQNRRHLTTKQLADFTDESEASIKGALSGMIRQADRYWIKEVETETWEITMHGMAVALGIPHTPPPPKPRKPVIPIVPNPAQGISLGLDWPWVYADAPSLGGWAVWHRGTGKLKALFPYDKNQHGYDLAQAKASMAAAPAHDTGVNFLHDLES